MRVFVLEGECKKDMERELIKDREKERESLIKGDRVRAR